MESKTYTARCYGAGNCAYRSKRYVFYEIVRFRQRINMDLMNIVALELQKLFAFLSLSKRRYGNVTQLTQMLKSNESGSQWNLQDMTVDGTWERILAAI